MLMRRALLIAVQSPAMIRKGSTLLLPARLIEWSANLCVARKICILTVSYQSAVIDLGGDLTIAATIGCNARKDALKYLFSNPAKL